MRLEDYSVCQNDVFDLQYNGNLAEIEFIVKNTRLDAIIFTSFSQFFQQMSGVSILKVEFYGYDYENVKTIPSSIPGLGHMNNALTIKLRFSKCNLVNDQFLSSLQGLTLLEYLSVVFDTNKMQNFDTVGSLLQSLTGLENFVLKAR